MEERLSAAGMSGSGTSTADILCDVQNHVAFITLNRPSALNALSFEMIGALRAELERCASGTDVRAILLQGAGDKAFCAGGDIRALYKSFKEGGTLHREFFAAEYPLDYLLHSFAKPYIVSMDGITMGGGMGIAQGSRFRIVGERTRVAMPEVGIGLFPDVGASFFLSRLPGCLGLYLALTGVQLRSADVLYAGLADMYLPPAAIDSLTRDLKQLEWTDDADTDIRGFLQSRAQQASDAPLRTLRPAIDLHFSKTTVPAILASLDRENREDYAEWALQTAKLIRGRSPTMLCVTLRQLERGKSLDLADCFRMERNMVAQCFVQGDFIEGVRALIVEKDNAPRWAPSRLEEVTEASVDAFFAQRWTVADHPLAGLDAFPSIADEHPQGNV